MGSLIMKPLIQYTSRDGHGDRWIYEEIVNNIYRVTGKERSIVDLGAHVGLFSVYARERCPSASIVAFECDRENFSFLQSNIKGLNIDARNFAISDHDGCEQFQCAKDRHQNSGNGRLVHASKAAAQDWNGCEIVQTFDAAYLPSCDLLKIDIEGSEVRVLKRMMQAKNRPERIAGEWHGQDTDSVLLALLSTYTVQTETFCKDVIGAFWATLK